MVMPPTISCSVCGTTNQPQALFCRACGNSLQPSAVPSVFNTATGRLLQNYTLKQRYRILRSVGKGGMGAVYQAEDTQLGNRKVALKEMSQSGLSPQEIAHATNAFRQEALILAGLQHPHLPSIYDHFSEFGRWYLVMSFIQGETLEEYLDKANAGRLPLEEALQIGIQLCAVLGYLHTQQPPIIFRDLKPSNIMRTPDGHIYLIDFGIARHFKPGQAKDTAAYGSMGYASPEQYGKAQTTPRSDIYSLGAVLHQLISGHHPASTPFRFPPLQAPGQVLPTELVTLIEQMLDLDENKRPTSMLVVKQKLQSLAVPTPVNASPLPPTLPAKAPLPSATIPANVTPLLPAASKHINVWSFGRQQIAPTLLGTLLCGVVAGVFLLLRVPFILGFIFLMPLFFGATYGPWVGLVAGGIGTFAGVLFISSSFHFHIAYGLALLVALLGFFAGLAFLKTRGRYDNFRNIAFACVVSTVEIGVILAALDLIYHVSLFEFFSVLPSIIPNLILLPLLLIAYNAFMKRKGYP